MFFFYAALKFKFSFAHTQICWYPERMRAVLFWLCLFCQKQPGKECPYCITRVFSKKFNLDNHINVHAVFILHTSVLQTADRLFMLIIFYNSSFFVSKSLTVVVQLSSWQSIQSSTWIKYRYPNKIIVQEKY